jgi:hypothetical protein
MKQIILGTMLLLTACSGENTNAQEETFESSDSALYDKAGRPLENTIVADIAWDRCHPKYEEIANRGAIPREIIYGIGLPKIDLKGKTVGAIGCVSFGRLYKGDNSVAHYGPGGVITRGWPKTTVTGGGRLPLDFNPLPGRGGELVVRDSTADTSALTSISVVKHEILGSSVDPLVGEHCTVGNPDVDFRNNPPDGMRKDRFNMPTGVVDHGVCDISVHPYKVVCTVAKRFANTPTPVWAKPSNRAQFACHP